MVESDDALYVCVLHGIMFAADDRSCRPCVYYLELRTSDADALLKLGYVKEDVEYDFEAASDPDIGGAYSTSKYIV